MRRPECGHSACIREWKEGSPEMIIKTRKLPATATAPTRMRATVQSESGMYNGATLTIPYPHGASDPNEYVANTMIQAMGYGPEEFTRMGDNRWECE